MKGAASKVTFLVLAAFFFLALTFVEVDSDSHKPGVVYTSFFQVRSDICYKLKYGFWPRWIMPSQIKRRRQHAATFLVDKNGNRLEKAKIVKLCNKYQHQTLNPDGNPLHYEFCYYAKYGSWNSSSNSPQETKCKSALLDCFLNKKGHRITQAEVQELCPNYDRMKCESCKRLAAKLCYYAAHGFWPSAVVPKEKEQRKFFYVGDRFINATEIEKKCPEQFHKLKNPNTHIKIHYPKCVCKYCTHPVKTTVKTPSSPPLTSSPPSEPSPSGSSPPGSSPTESSPTYGTPFGPPPSESTTIGSSPSGITPSRPTPSRSSPSGTPSSGSSASGPPLSLTSPSGPSPSGSSPSGTLPSHSSPSGPTSPSVPSPSGSTASRPPPSGPSSSGSPPSESSSSGPSPSTPSELSPTGPTSPDADCSTVTEVTDSSTPDDSEDTCGHSYFDHPTVTCTGDFTGETEQYNTSQCGSSPSLPPGSSPFGPPPSGSSASGPPLSSTSPSGPSPSGSSPSGTLPSHSSPSGPPSPSVPSPSGSTASRPPPSGPSSSGSPPSESSSSGPSPSAPSELSPTGPTSPDADCFTVTEVTDSSTPDDSEDTCGHSYFDHPTVTCTGDFTGETEQYNTGPCGSSPSPPPGSSPFGPPPSGPSSSGPSPSAPSEPSPSGPTSPDADCSTVTEVTDSSTPDDSEDTCGHSYFDHPTVTCTGDFTGETEQYNTGPCGSSPSPPPGSSPFGPPPSGPSSSGPSPSAPSEPSPSGPTSPEADCSTITEVTDSSTPDDSEDTCGHSYFDHPTVTCTGSFTGETEHYNTGPTTPCFCDVKSTSPAFCQGGDIEEHDDDDEDRR